MAAALAVVGAIGLFTLSVGEPAGVAQVEALNYTTHWTSKIETSGADNNGVSHTSKVRYNRRMWPSPIRYEVTKVRYEARKPDIGFLWERGHWKRDFTKYRDRDSSSDNWTTVLSTSGSWANAEEDLTEYDLDDSALLHTNASVIQRLRYKERNWLFNYWWEAPGPIHVHEPN